jgi:hypothetical protein
MIPGHTRTKFFLAVHRPHTDDQDSPAEVQLRFISALGLPSAQNANVDTSDCRHSDFLDFGIVGMPSIASTLDTGILSNTGELLRAC